MTTPITVTTTIPLQANIKDYMNFVEKYAEDFRHSFSYLFRSVVVMPIQRIVDGLGSKTFLRAQDGKRGYFLFEFKSIIEFSDWVVNQPEHEILRFVQVDDIDNDTRIKALSQAGDLEILLKTYVPQTGFVFVFTVKAKSDRSHILSTSITVTDPPMESK